MNTLLDAVNHVLRAIREQPVSSLELAPLPDEVAMSLEAITRVSREIQAEGWWFNTVPKQTFTPDTSTGEITLPASVIRVRSLRYIGSASTVTQRGTKLFNPSENTYSFAKPVEAFEVVTELPWEQIPYKGREYIAKRAAREVASDVIGSMAVMQSSAYNESEARASLEREELLNASPVWMDNPDMLSLDLRTNG